MSFMFHVHAAARMESNGKKDCIHVSEATAKLLMDSGKQRWLTPRKDRVVAKGKGEMQTYWLEVRTSLANNVENTPSRRCSGDTDADDADGSSMGDSNSDLEPKVPEWEKDVSSKGTSQALGDRYQRLVDWNVDQLVTLLKKVAANRKSLKPGDANGSTFDLRTDSSVLREVTEVIPFPNPGIADIIIGDTTGKPDDVELDSAVVAQLHEFMTSIAIMYNDNSFHNVSLVQSTLAPCSRTFPFSQYYFPDLPPPPPSKFAHASHVAMALITWLSRLTPLPSKHAKENVYEAKGSGNWKWAANPSKDMYALQSDPFTHFSLVFAALVHDLEHSGVPNAQVRPSMASQ